MVAAQRTLLSLAAASATLFSMGESTQPLRFHRRQLNSTASSASSTSDDYVYPPDLATGTVQTRFGTEVPEVTGHPTTSVGLGAPAKYPSSNQGPPGSGEAFTPTISRGSWSVPNNATTPVTTVDAQPQSQPTAPATTLSGTQVPQGNETTTHYTNTTSAATTQQGTTTGVVTMTSGQYSGTYRWCSSAELAVSTVTVYPSTITFYGNRSQYTPPVPETTPERTCRDGSHKVRLTLSHCETGKPASSCETTLATLTPEVGIFTIETTSSAGYKPFFSMASTSTFTAKNPSVVFSPFSTPGFGDAPTKQANEHESASPTGAGPVTTPSFDTGGDSQGRNPAQGPITLAVQPSGVVINSQTFSDPAGGGRQTVVKDGQTFTIDSTAVVGAGVSVDRAAANGGAFVPTPVTTRMGGLDVVASSTVVVVEGTTFTIPMGASTAVVHGQTVSFGPSGISIASETISVSRSPLPTEVVLAGGEAITAIGQSVVVIRGTTITYGQEAQRVTMIDGESIIIGSTGVVVHGTTLGGLNAGESETAYEIVGGATFTEIGASIVAIDGQTFTVGPGSPTITTVVSGHTLTLGPNGVGYSTTTLQYPFGPTTTITPGATPASAASQTSSRNAEPSIRPDWFLSLFLTCIAIGVRVFGFLL